MDKKTFRYSLENDTEDSSTFEADWVNTPPHHLAEIAAEHYFDNGESWSDFETWPLIFTIYSPSGEKMGAFEVELEAMPSFFASEYKEQDKT